MNSPKKTLPMTIFPYGAVLKIQREWTLTEIRKSLRGMRAIGMNHVVVWPAVYWWEDRRGPHYPFQTGRDILRIAESLGIRVTMELEGQITCLEYAPDFLMKDEYFPVDRDGHRLNKGVGYGFLNYNHPEVRMLIHRMFTDTAQQYRGHPALYGYDIYNETKFESFDHHTLQCFREWLEAKYGDIERLNAAWERTYTDWSQIQFCFWMWASVMPTVDFNQFKKANMGLILKDWAAVVKAVDPGIKTIADNVYSTVSMDEHYALPQDDWNVAASVDEFGISLYPKNDAVGLPPCRRWHTLAGVHSASKAGRFWISELQSHNVGMFNPFSVVRPHELRWWNWEAVAHGAMGIIYWKWDPFIKGIQTLGRGLVDTHGRRTIRANEARAIRKIMAAHERDFCRYVPERPKVAILYDPLNHDFTKAYTQTHGQKLSDSIYLDSIAGLYDVLWSENVPADFIIPEKIIQGGLHPYTALFISNQVTLAAGLAAALKSYVRGGGTVVCDGRFGMVDDLGVVQTELPGGDFNALLGFRFEDIEPDGLTIQLQDGPRETMTFEGFYERQHLRVRDPKVKVLGRFADRRPAVLERVHGKGRVIFIATCLWYGYRVRPSPGVESFFRQLKDRLHLAVHSINDNRLKFRVMRGDRGVILLVFNYGDTPIDASVSLSGIPDSITSVTDLYTTSRRRLAARGGILELDVTLPGRDVALYKITTARQAPRPRQKIGWQDDRDKDPGAKGGVFG